MSDARRAMRDNRLGWELWANPARAEAFEEAQPEGAAQGSVVEDDAACPG